MIGKAIRTLVGLLQFLTLLAILGGIVAVDKRLTSIQESVDKMEQRL